MKEVACLSVGLDVIFDSNRFFFVIMVFLFLCFRLGMTLEKVKNERERVYLRVLKVEVLV